MKEVCFDNKVPAVNCRTCAFSEPIFTGTEAEWHCHKQDCEFTGQGEVCKGHLFLNTLVPFKTIDVDKSSDFPEWIKYSTDAGDVFYNVTDKAKTIPVTLVLTSSEIYDNVYFEPVFSGRQVKNEALKENIEEKKLDKKLKGLI